MGSILSYVVVNVNQKKLYCFTTTGGFDTHILRIRFIHLDEPGLRSHQSETEWCLCEHNLFQHLF